LISNIRPGNIIDNYIIIEERRIDPRVKAVLELLDELSIKSCRKYVDIGCGDCSYTLIIGQKLQCREVHGVDIDEDRILLASKRGIITIKADMNKERLSLAENSIDIVTALEVIEHLVNPDNMLQEIYRILKPGGYLIITTPNLASKK
jgi:2-polyprenyl-3-methyl-5-hydroxy-6-metoxy-1,4-benzoquinol methylase